MEWIIIILYGIMLMAICLFSLGQFNLTFHYLRSKKIKKEKLDELKEYPLVTIQLPIYNEQYVVERLIDAVCKMTYPKDKLEIQILDDSTDETIDLIKQKVDFYTSKGWDIKQVRRPERVGYKAGALAYGLEKAKGSFLAIFDADFIPNPKFFIQTLPNFKNSRIGMVQTKWTHLNRNYGWLTKIQAFWLDAHFTVEQKGREQAGSFINFNGTAGVWKKECIQDAGGWKHDTITEDLDLSYRAQLKGWKFVYCEEIESPSELPIVISAVKSQQYRWNKGAAETAKKMLGKVFKSNMGWRHKIHASFHLLNSSVFSLLLFSSLLSIPMLYIKENNPDLALLFDLGSVFIIGFIGITFFYWVASKTVHPEYTLNYFLKHFPIFLAFSMGMALHNTIAVAEGYLGIKTPFVRTPKFNIQTKKESWKGNVYFKNILTPVTFMEGLLSLYFIYGIFSAFKLEDYGLILFHGMLTIGFAYVFLLSVKQMKNA